MKISRLLRGKEPVTQNLKLCDLPTFLHKLIDYWEGRMVCIGDEEMDISLNSVLLSKFDLSLQ